MYEDPYAVMRALVRAEAARSTSKKPQPERDTRKPQQSSREREHG